ncbi:alpha-galactosidase D [Penicillium canariense]|uniref:alpha-galactosidase n=1 Tax=Penicillium canariense TaxID=189055 RepID=A0A9W9HQA2_9EURO|nr:alpha-galactosidase D [Penicillium canariense]KAJ5152695.1 alpha-galactosidase D [Penicillium canariense]
MLEVGNNILTPAEEQTHFSLWAILKSPLVIGAALNDETTSIGDVSLSILSSKDVISFNQDALGVSANLRRRWSEEQYEVWSGPLANGRTVVALINWAAGSRELTLNLPDVGIQHAGTVKNIWAGQTIRTVKTSYTATVDAHGVMLLELEDTTEAGLYPSNKFASSVGFVVFTAKWATFFVLTLYSNKVTFDSVYANTSSSNHTISIVFSRPASSSTSITVQSSTNPSKHTIHVPASSKSVSTSISLTAGSSNKVVIDSSLAIHSIQIKSPLGTYYPSTEFTLTGSASLTQCGDGFCQPVGAKIGFLDSTNTAKVTISATIPSSSGDATASKYLELDYINNDIAFSSSWGWGSNSRNVTISVNGGEPVRLEVPLSGRHSELFGPGLGWWDTSSLGVLVGGWKDGDNEVVVANVAGSDAFQTWGADFVGVRVYD